MNNLLTTLDVNLGGLVVPHLSEYFGEWAIEERRFSAMVEHVRSVNLSEHVRAGLADLEARAAAGQSNTGEEYEVSDGVALISLSGTLMKQVGSLSRGTSTVQARRMVRAAANDPEVRGIVLVIDSPGGTVSGTSDLASEVAAAAQKKRVVAYIEDLGASAAYWIASQASEIRANDTAQVGSIGTFAVLEDYSTRAAQMGVKVHVIRAGQFKGAGVPGTEVTSEHLAEYQRVINALNDRFLGAVATGRRMKREQVDSLNTGQVWIGAEAKALGLIDEVSTLAGAIDSARDQSKGRKTFGPTRGASMSLQDSLKAHLTGNEAGVSADHKDLCAEIADIVRAHDKAGHEKASADAAAAAVEKFKAEQPAAPDVAAAVKAERERCAGLLESAAATKMPLTLAEMAPVLRSDNGPADMLAAAAKHNPSTPAAKDYKADAQLEAEGDAALARAAERREKAQA